MDGLFLDQWGAECLALDGVVEGVFCADAGESEGSACKCEALWVEVWIAVSANHCLDFKGPEILTRHNEGEALVLFSNEIFSWDTDII